MTRVCYVTKACNVGESPGLIKVIRTFLGNGHHNTKCGNAGRLSRNNIVVCTGYREIRFTRTQGVLVRRVRKIRGSKWYQTNKINDERV